MWIARKNYLCVLVRRVSDAFGGDSLDFVRAHCRELIERYPDGTIEETVRCYESIPLPYNMPVPPPVSPPQQGYIAPFIDPASVPELLSPRHQELP